MSSEVERNFVQHLFDLDSMDVLARDGFDQDLLPTTVFRLIYAYALRYYFDSGRTRAINRLALETYEVSRGVSLSDLLDQKEVPIEEPDLPIVDVMAKLKGQYAISQFDIWQHKTAADMTNAPNEERLQVAQDASVSLVRILMRLESHRTRVDAGEGLEERLLAYADRAANTEIVDGIGFGLPPIDTHTHRIHPGEVGVLAAAPKTGKSMMADIVALSEHRQGRSVALFSLENSIDMTLDRIACIACSVDSSQWQTGACSEDDIKRVRAFKDDVRASDTPLWVLQPASGYRTVEAMVRQAQSLEVDSLLIDQLSHIEHPDPGRKPRHEVVRDIMQDLHLMASDHRHPMPVLVVHQISRDGKKNADKLGYHIMSDLAESAEVERSADFVFTLYQSHDASLYGQVLFQILASRRTALKWWSLLFAINLGAVRVKNEEPMYQNG